MKINKAAYERLVQEDLAWLRQQPDSLENRHIQHIVSDSVATYYPEDDEVLTAYLDAFLTNPPARDPDRVARIRALFLRTLQEEGYDWRGLKIAEPPAPKFSEPQ